MPESFDSAFSGGAKGFSYNPSGRDAAGNALPNPYFVPVGAPHGGKVLDIQLHIPVTEFTGPNKGLPKFWDEAKTRPMEQKVIVVDTKQGKYPAPSAGPDDDGLRSFWIRDSSDLEKAVKKALQVAPGLAIGSDLYVVNTGTRPSKGGGTDARTFAAQHVPGQPTPQDSFFGGEPAAPTYNPQVTTPAPQADPFASPAASQFDPRNPFS